MKKDGNAFEDFVKQDLTLNNDPEVQAVLNEIEAAYDKLFIVVMKKRYDVEVSYIEGDNEHIVIDGVVYDDDAFWMWLRDKEFEMYSQNHSDDDWPEDDSEVGQA